MKRSVLLLIIGVLVLVTLACSGFDGVTKSGVQIKVDNQSPEEVCYVYISLSASDSWGDDQLAGDEILPGKSKTFSVEEGTYDVGVENCDEVIIGTGWEMSSDATIKIGQSGATVRLLLDNTTTTELCFVHIAPVTEGEWGDDQMGDMESISPGGKRMFFVEPGIYDLMVADCDGETVVEEYEVDLNSDLRWAIE